VLSLLPCLGLRAVQLALSLLLYWRYRSTSDAAFAEERTPGKAEAAVQLPLPWLQHAATKAAPMDAS